MLVHKSICWIFQKILIFSQALLITSKQMEWEQLVISGSDIDHMVKEGDYSKTGQCI